MSISKDTAITRAIEVHGSKYDYSMIGDYKNLKTKYPIICHEKDENGNEHGTFMMDFSHHINRKQGCPKCKSRKLHNLFKVPNEDFIKRCKDKFGDTIGLDKVNYINSTTPITITCKKHGDVDVNPISFINGKGCPLCNPKMFTKEIVEEKILEKYGGNIEYISKEYQGIDSIAEFFCKKHNVVFKKKVFDALHKNACQLCGVEKRRVAKLNTRDEVIKRFKQTHGDKYSYSLIDEGLMNLREKVPIQCNKHGIFLQSPNNHIKGEGCPKCKESFGEREIAKALSSEDILYIQQKSFDFLKTKNGKQTLDFYIPSKRIGIEFQGSQHFIEIGMFGGERGLDERIERDKRKNKLCEENGVELYYIIKKCDEKHISEYDFYDKRHTFTSIEDFIDNILKLDKDNGKQQRTDMP